MIRKLLLLAVMAVTAFAFSAASASAFEVEVENPGMFAITGSNTISIHGTFPEEGNELTGLKCNNTWEANIDSSGHINVHSIVLSSVTGSIGQCNSVDDCDDAGWEGQIEEHSPHWEYAVHAVFCLEDTGNPETDDIAFPVECQFTPAAVHCGGTHDGHDNAAADPAEEESQIFIHQIAPGVFVEFFVEGELTINPPVQIHHVEKG